MVVEQVVGVQFVLGFASGEGLVSRPDRLAAINATRKLRPHGGIDPHPVIGKDADVFADWGLEHAFIFLKLSSGVCR